MIVSNFLRMVLSATALFLGGSFASSPAQAATCHVECMILEIEFTTETYFETTYDTPYGVTSGQIDVKYDTGMAASGMLRFTLPQKPGPGKDHYKADYVSYFDGVFDYSMTDETFPFLHGKHAKLEFDAFGSLTDFEVEAALFASSPYSQVVNLKVSADETTVAFEGEYRALGDTSLDPSWYCSIGGNCIRSASAKATGFSQLTITQTAIPNVPLPGALPLLGLGLMGFVALRRNRRT